MKFRQLLVLAVIAGISLTASARIPGENPNKQPQKPTPVQVQKKEEPKKSSFGITNSSAGNNRADIAARVQQREAEKLQAQRQADAQRQAAQEAAAQRQAAQQLAAQRQAAQQAQAAAAKPQPAPIQPAPQPWQQTNTNSQSQGRWAGTSANNPPPAGYVSEEEARRRARNAAVGGAAGGTVVGGVVGYEAGRAAERNSRVEYGQQYPTQQYPQYPTQQQYPAQPPVMQQPAPQVIPVPVPVAPRTVPANSSSGGSGFGTVLVILLIIGVGVAIYFGIKAMSKKPATSSYTPVEPQRSSEPVSQQVSAYEAPAPSAYASKEYQDPAQKAELIEFFLRLQGFYNTKNAEALTAMTSPAMLSAIKEAFVSNGFVASDFSNVDVSIEENSDTHVVAFFEADCTDSNGTTRLKEVWNIKKDAFGYILDGIDTIS